MEKIVEFLFKYDPIVFSRGAVSFAGGLPRSWLLILLLGLLAVVLMLYHRTGGSISLAAKIGLASVRFSLLLLILLCLLQPVIRIPTVVPQRSFVAVLVDDSQSMGIADETGARRIDLAQSLLSQTSDFSRGLEDKFKLRWYTFSSAAARTSATPLLQAAGGSTNLAAAIETALSDLQGLPLSAIVLLSDGANNVRSDFSPLINTLKANRVPLYVLGLGREQLENDVELIKVDAPPAVLQGSTISAALTLKGGQSRRARVKVLEGQRVVKSQSVPLQRTGDVQTISVELTPTGAGLKHYLFVIEPPAGDIISQNNQRDVMVMVKDENPRVLYVEGEPRWEYGKLRTALEDEKNVTLSSILRTAKNKYYRQGIETPDELASGFPRTKEELFTFKGLILGSLEANFFSFDQLKNIEAFVAERGGGFLMLGGRSAFSAGGYATTPIADLLPVRLADEAGEAVPLSVKPTLTFNGRQHPITQLGQGPGASAAVWEQLPSLTVLEPLSRTKPGAVVLLRGQPARGRPVALLSSQRYGRGRSLAFTATDSWRWQMQMPYEDQSHQAFWKQLLRYLVSDSPDQVMVRTNQDAYDVSDSVHIQAEINGRDFIPLNDATVTSRIRSPGGKRETVPLQWTAESGDYEGQMAPQERGVHSIEIVARKEGKTIGQAQAGFMVGDLNREYRDPRQHAQFLRHLAKETGGRYYTSATASRLPQEIAYLDNTSSVNITKELWDMPINFLLIIGLVSVEWFLRKRKRLP